MSTNRFKDQFAGLENEASQKIPTKVEMPKVKEKRERVVPLTITVTPSRKAKIRAMADARDMSVSKIVSYWIDQIED